MKVDLSITISAILGCAAIISPVLTAIINNHYQIKLKKLELKRKHYEDTVVYKRTIFENYIRLSGKCTSESGVHPVAAQEYHEAFFYAFLYAPENLRTEMQEVDTYIRKCDTDSAVQLFEKLIPKLQAYIEEL